MTRRRHHSLETRAVVRPSEARNGAAMTDNTWLALVVRGCQHPVRRATIPGTQPGSGRGSETQNPEAPGNPGRFKPTFFVSYRQDTKSSELGR
jgi:hypothetical protein